MRTRRALAAALAVVAAGVSLAIILGSSGGRARRAPATATLTPSPITSTANTTRPPTTSTPAKAPPTAIPLGANVGRLFNDRTYSLTAMAAQLAALRQTGVTVARSDALWEATEPTAPSGSAHHYEWAFDDSIAGALAAQGIRWLPIIDYSAPWTESIPGRDHSPPKSSQDYAAYAAALAQRYGPGGSFWQGRPDLKPQPVETYEIWNEPDNDIFWSSAPQPAAYAQLYLRARAAIHAAQPGARVLVGGLTHPATFLPALLAAAPALRSQLDGVAIHTYGGSPEAVLGIVRSARATLVSRGLGDVPLYDTEFGWTTSPPGALDYLPERLRPAYIEHTVAALGHTDCGLAGAFIYAWVTPERDPGDPQDWFGIHPPGGGSSVDSAAFAQGIAAASRPAPVLHLCPQP